jgi:hypothetical protein
VRDGLWRRLRRAAGRRCRALRPGCRPGGRGCLTGRCADVGDGASVVGG